ENLMMASTSGTLRLKKPSARRELAAVNASVRGLHIRAHSPRAPVSTLSGGNQQKVVLGKWLETKPRLLILDDPTRGVDVGAKAEIYALVEELTARGHAVVLASSDLPEVVRLADRVIVLREGVPAGELAGADITPIRIMQLAVGTVAAVMAQEALGEART
ncbi:MAG TPA: ATP-binding cassette domain-containing protein, partial [Kofleriaceae bacterium]